MGALGNQPSQFYPTEKQAFSAPANVKFYALRT